jgi:hypothetical protein
VTQEDQDAIVGKAHREYKEAKKRLAAIETMGGTIAQTASNLAKALADPSRIVVPAEGEAVVGPMVMTSFVFTTELANQISHEHVKEIVADYKQTKQRVSSLRQQLLSLGENPD